MDTDEAAYGVYRIGAAAMARAVRAVTVERGLDPREFSVVAFGGNGPLFAVEVARSLEIRTVVVPPAPGVFSAVGLLEARVERHLTRAFSRRLSELDSAEVTATAGAVRDAAIRDLASDNGAHRINCAVHGDLRYVGQTFGLRIALPTAADASLASALAAAFGEEHERTYGFRLPDAEVQLVNLRATAFVNEERRRPAPHHRDAYRPAGTEREAHFGPSYGRLVSPVLPRDGLDGTWRPGPLMVEEYDTVTLVPPGARARLDDHHNIVVETGDPE
jgi:N-methylhydantoinase A